MILRVVVVVLAFFAGAGLLFYAAAWLFMPLDRTNKSLVSEALGADSTDRVRSVLTTAALLAVLAISAVIALDGGFVPGLLIALVVVAVLLVVRRDENATASGRPGYAPPGASPPVPTPPAFGAPTYGGTTYGEPPYGPAQYGQPQYGQPQYGQSQYGQSQYAAPAYGGSTSPLGSSSPSPYPSATAATEPTVVTDPSTEATVVTDTSAEPTVVADPSVGSGSEPTAVLGQPPLGAESTTTWPAIPSPSYVPPAAGAPPWQPPDVPPTPTYFAEQDQPPVPRRERSYLGVLTVSAMIAVLGAMGIVDLSGVGVPVAGYLVAALAVVAGGLVLGAWVGRSRGLIALGIILGLAIGPAILVDAVAGTEWRDWRSADNIRLAPQTPEGLAALYDYGGGSFRLDLTSLDFEGEELATMIDMGAGEVIVTVPPDVDVVVDGSIVAGELTLFDRRSSGFDATDVFTDLGADGVGGGQLDLTIDLGLGKVEVRRATS